MAKCVLNAARHFLVPPEAALASVGTFHFFVAVAAVRFILCALFVPLFFWCVSKTVIHRASGVCRWRDNSLQWLLELRVDYRVYLLLLPESRGRRSRKRVASASDAQ